MIDYNKYTIPEPQRVSSNQTICKVRTIHKRKKSKLTKQNEDFLKLIGLKK